MKQARALTDSIDNGDESGIQANNALLKSAIVSLDDRLAKSQKKAKVEA